MTENKKQAPYDQLLRVIKTHPKSALLYIQLWKHRSPKGIVYIEKDRIRKKFLMSPTVFRNMIIPLASMEMISYSMDDHKYTIEVFGKDQ